ncbi:MAG TPA: RNA-binding protein [Nitrososphaeraceae archaeon]
MLLKDLEMRRETLIKGTREIIILCSKAIVSIHKGDDSEAEKILLEAMKLLVNFKGIAGIDLDKYLSVSEQELTEGLALLSIVKFLTIPSLIEMGVTGPSYVLGLLDCIGEIKRIIYDKLRKGESEKIEILFKIMNNVYGSVYPLAGYDNLVPGLRKKLDVSKHLIEDVRAVMTDEARRKVVLRRMDLFEDNISQFFEDNKRNI